MIQNDRCVRRRAAILVCGVAMLLSTAAPSYSRANLSVPVAALQNRVPNATPVPSPPLREADRCIGYYQPCGRGPFRCCPGLQCLPLTNTGSVCGPPPHRQ